MKRFIAKVSKSFKGGEKGFTLIELLIVIVILGVLAAAIIPNLSKFVGTGRVGAANAELASVRTAVSAFIAESTTGTLPTSNGLPGDLVLADVTPYISGAAISGEYTIGAGGTVTGVTYPLGVAPADGGLTWDGTPNFRWKK